MKTFRLALVAVAVGALVGCGGSTADAVAADDADVTSDVCRGKALTAAENEYGNSPDGTKTKVLTKSRKSCGSCLPRWEADESAGAPTVSGLSAGRIPWHAIINHR